MCEDITKSLINLRKLLTSTAQIAFVGVDDGLDLIGEEKNDFHVFVELLLANRGWLRRLGRRNTVGNIVVSCFADLGDCVCASRDPVD